MFSFWELARIFSKWWQTVGLFVVLVLSITTAVLLYSTPIYRAIAIIEIKQEDAKIIDIDEVEQITANAEFIETQYSLLQSNALIERVVKTLNLASAPLFAEQSLERPARTTQAIQHLKKNISIQPVGRSRLVEIRFDSPAPEQAAQIVNQIAQEFISFHMERRHNSILNAQTFLEQRIEATKRSLEKAERDLIAYADAEGIADLSTTKSANTGPDTSGSLDNASLAALNDELSVVLASRIEIEERYNAARRSQFAADIQTDSLIKNLREERNTLENEYEEKLAYLKPDFPEMAELQSRIASIDTQIEGQTDRITRRLKSQLETVRARESQLRVQIERLKDNIISVRKKSIDYAILERDVDTYTSQYDALLQRLKEINISSGSVDSLVSIIDRAQVPGTPHEPDYVRSLLIALLLSTMIGFGLACIYEMVDDRIKSPEHIKTQLHTSVLGVIPMLTEPGNFAQTLKAPQSGPSEAYAALRTNLAHASTNGMPRVMQITSTRAGEGKSSTVFALGKSIAALGYKTLIIDADLRMPAFMKGAETSPGLAGLLTDKAPLETHVVETQIPNLYLLPAGHIPHNPTELLADKRFEALLTEARQKFHTILIDSPPVLGLADAPLIGSKSDATILVIEAAAIRTQTARLTIERLLASNSSIIGTVLTKYKPDLDGYQAYYQYSYGRKFHTYGRHQKTSTRSIADEQADSSPQKTRMVDVC